MKRIEKFIIRKLKEEDYVLTVHARKRMNERNITDADIVEVAYTLKSIHKQDQNDSYLLTGRDTWGEKLMVSVAARDDIIVVTVFFEE